MRRPDRKEIEVRALLEAQPHPPVPADLAERALARGLRLARRRRAAAVVLWAFFAAVLALAVWAGITEPWASEPAQTTPPTGW